MRRLNIATNGFLCVILLSLFASPALACRPKFQKVSDYVENRIPDHVIFLGTVISVEEKQVREGVSAQNIEFRTARWFGGKPQNTISVRGFIGSWQGTNCQGMSDFSAKTGEEWLIFGRLHDGKVNPDSELSRKIVKGEIPAALLKELKWPDSNPLSGK